MSPNAAEVSSAAPASPVSAGVKQGVDDFLVKPPDTDRLVQVIGRAAERQGLLRRVAASAATGEPSLVAESPVGPRSWRRSAGTV